ncbi:MAG: universal stress protein [Desulfobacterales bacterium]|nr:universal stress protein [Desulfobacterales bacterium]
MRIMVGYDGSNVSKDALMLAKKHAKAFKAKVDVVTSMVKGTQYQLPEIEKEEHDLEWARQLFEEDGIACETHLLIRGLNPGEDLVQFAKENKVNEIIIGVRKRSKVGKFLLGSTAQYVVIEASCPVVTVK